MRIWLIGDTSDSAIWANLLIKANLACIITVTTPEAHTLYQKTHFL